MIRFTKTQLRLLTVCVVLYTVLYFCRLNLSAALDAITRDLNISIASAGLLQTVFALVYACGQIVNGAVADRVNPFRHMLLGLFGSSACNLIMSLSVGYPMMIVSWTANAVFQSMLWTPIVRVVALNFSGLRERNAANAALAFVLIVGHFFAWAISGVMAEHFSWRLSFAVPAAIAAITAVLSIFVLPELREKNADAGKKAVRKAQGTSSSSVLTSVSFLLVLATCIVYGFVRDGVITWTPTILAHMGREKTISSTAFTLILPVINTIGVALGIWQRGRGANPRVVVATMMAAGLVCCACLLGISGLLVTALLLGCICAAMYGANTMLTSVIPLEYDAVGKTGTTAGMIDASIYLGSALAGVLAGGIYERSGVQMLYGIWAICCVVAGMMMIASKKKGNE